MFVVIVFFLFNSYDNLHCQTALYYIFLFLDSLSLSREKTSMNSDHIIGCILGTAVGDALGLPYEGLTPQRAERLFKKKDRYHFFFNKGMISDDTEHTCMVAQSLIESRGNSKLFAKWMAWRLRFWLLGLPAGVGFATLRSILKLWCGFPPDKSGVFSAGNGPAMRSALIGVCYGHDETKLIEFVRVSTVITHTDPKSYWGALAVALAAHTSCSSETIDGSQFYDRLKTLLSSEPASKFLDLIETAVSSSQNGQSTKNFATSLGLEKGVTGYVYHTVPVVIQAWLSHPQDFQSGILEILACGGDTDTTGAILGGIIGSRTGKQGIPEKWIETLCEWPRSVSWMEKLGRQLAETNETKALRLPVFGIILRNIVFLTVVLFHGFRRLLPPF
jgi:ADP-ribosyl-[dinitrogen reductase] hydrolase